MTDNLNQAGGLTSDARAALVEERLGALREIVDRRGAKAIRLATRRDFAWLTLGGANHVLLSAEAGVAPIVVTATDAVVVSPANERDRIADEELAGLPIDIASVPWWDDEAAARETSRLVDGGPILEVDDVAADLEQLRTALVPAEHERMRVLARATNELLADALAGVARGTTEHDLAAAANEAVARAGARLPVILVAADARIERYRHPIPTDTAVERRVMVIVVVEKWGLHVAATGFRELEERGSDIDARAAAISDVMARMRETTKPGRTLGDVFAAARAAYDDHGLADEWTRHHQGGTIGYAARERIAKPDDPTLIRAGMAFAWNPSAVGYKTEETLLLDERGEQEILTS